MESVCSPWLGRLTGWVALFHLLLLLTMPAFLHADWIGCASARCRSNHPPTPSWPCTDASMKPLHSLTLLSPYAHGSATQNLAIVVMQDSQTDQPHACVRCTVSAQFDRPTKGQHEHGNMNVCLAHRCCCFFVCFFYFFPHSTTRYPSLTLSGDSLSACACVCPPLFVWGVLHFP